jgi:type IV pilus assembly protein PilB
MSHTKKRLGELLIEAGVIDEHQLLNALGHQKQWGVKLGQALVDLKIATELQIVDALARKLGYEAVRLDRIEPSPIGEAALKLVPRELARAQNLLPLATDTNSVTIAMSDPTNVAIIDEIAFRTGKRVRVVLAGDRELARAIRKAYFPEELLRPPAIDVPVGGSEAMETTTDWYAAMPPSMREEYLGEHQLTFEEDEEPAPRPTAKEPSPASVAVAVNAPHNGVGAPPTLVPQHAVPPAASASVLVDVINRMLRGEKAPGGLEPGRLAAATVRVLLRKGLVSEAELLAELMKK